MYSSNSIQVENGKKEYSKMREYRRPSLATSLAVIDENKCPETFEIKTSSSPLLCNGIEEDDKEQIENGNEDEIESDLETLKNKANQLKLKTRRPSYVTWTSQCLINSGSLIKPRLDSVPVEIIDNVNTDTDDWSEERKDKINEALSWIRNQLVSSTHVKTPFSNSFRMEWGAIIALKSSERKTWILLLQKSSPWRSCSTR